MNEQEKNQDFYIEKVSDINSKKEKAPLAFIETYGCQQNVSDSEKLKGMAEKMGFTITENANEADLIIFNTCAIRDSAEKKVYGKIGALKHFKNKKSSLLIVVCGCMPQQEHVADEIKKKYRHIDMVFGTHALYKFPEILYSAITEKERIFSIEDIDGIIAEGIPVKRESNIKAWVTIMYGCNNFCSYCVVPYVRGRERSRKPENIINEIKGLVDEGYKDITLLGQNVNSYGKDLELNIDFSDLLRLINDIDGEFRVRFMTSHPKDATKKLIDTIAECKKVSKHIHLPVQSGSDRILKLMNRHYIRESYLELIDYAKSKIDNLVLTSDIIVGFPTETEEDFNDTIDLIEKVRFDTLFTFIFSKRKGTSAEKMEGQITYEDKHKRFNILLKVQNDISKQINEAYSGKTVKVLAEGYSETDKNMLTGRTDGNKIVNFSGSENLIGQFIDVEITETKTWSLFGRQA